MNELFLFSFALKLLFHLKVGKIILAKKPFLTSKSQIIDTVEKII